MRLLLFSAFLAASAFAQEKPEPIRLKPLRLSPACTVSQDIGISRVEVSFSRPAVKGRKIWGGLVPFGQVWRAGANSATTITLSHAAKVAGKDLSAGTYGFFVIPNEKTWTLILNKKGKQWGSYDYKAEEDVLRWDVLPQSAALQERLDYRVIPESIDQATVELGWEKLRVSFPVSFDTKALYWTHLEETLKKAPDTDWIPWYQAARYCQEQGVEPEKGLAWIEKSLKISETYGNTEVAARILKDAKRMPEALAYLQKAADLSRGKTPKAYTEELEKELADWKAGK